MFSTYGGSLTLSSLLFYVMSLLRVFCLELNTANYRQLWRSFRQTRPAELYVLTAARDGAYRPNGQTSQFLLLYTCTTVIQKDFPVEAVK